jgi:MYXO-CTERM domain-containing protein
MVMLELLEEAGAEAVTLDELGVAGVRDPARALLELELAGLEIQRVLVRGEREDRAFECIRLAGAAAPHAAESPTVELAALAPRPPAALPEITVQPAPADARRRGYVLLAVLLALAALVLRRR